MSADRIGRRIGIDKTALGRVRSGFAQAVAEAIDGGHCGLPIDAPTAPTARLVAVPAAPIETARCPALEAGEFIAATASGRGCLPGESASPRAGDCRPAA